MHMRLAAHALRTRRENALRGKIKRRSETMRMLAARKEVAVAHDTWSAPAVYHGKNGIEKENEEREEELYVEKINLKYGISITIQPRKYNK